MFDFYRKNRNLQGSAVRRSNRNRSLRQVLIWEGPLEDRRLLAISWANRNLTDNFGVFGANAGTARGVVDQAISYWNSYLNISTPYALDVTISADLGNGASTSISNYQFTAGRWRPDTATITVDAGNDGTGGGYFFDPTPADNSEYETVFSPYVLNTGPGSPANGLGDFLSLITHEIGHALGYTSRFLAPDGQTVIGGGIGYDNPFTANTGQVYSDPTAAPPSATYWIYDSPTVNSVLTNFNSGGGGEAFAGPVHAAENTGAGRAIAWAGSTYFTSLDLMTPYYSFNQRKLITCNTVNVINESVGWGLGATPLASALINLDAAGNLFVSGDSTDNLITVSTSALGMVDVVVTTQIMGVLPNNMITASFPAGLVRSVTVDAARGDDTVDLSNYIAVANPAPVIIGGWGNDLIYGSRLADDIRGDIDNDTIYGGDGNDSIDGGDGTLLMGGSGDLIPFAAYGGFGNDTISGRGFFGMEMARARITAYGEAGRDTIQGGTHLDHLFGGDDADLFFWQPGDGLDMIDGGTGSDAFIVIGSDGTDCFEVRHDFALATQLRVNVDISGGPALDGSILAADVEHVSLEGGAGDDLFSVDPVHTTPLVLLDIDFGAGNADVVELNLSNAGGAIDVTSSDTEASVDINDLSEVIRLFGASVQDTLVVNGGESGDIVRVTPEALAEISVVVNGNAGDDVITGATTVVGGPGNDSIVGTALADVLLGGLGNDTIHGLAGDDLILGDADGTGAGNGHDRVRQRHDGCRAVRDSALCRRGRQRQHFRRRRQ